MTPILRYLIWYLSSIPPVNNLLCSHPALTDSSLALATFHINLLMHREEKNIKHSKGPKVRWFMMLERKKAEPQESKM